MEKAGLGSCIVCCIGVTCCPEVVVCKGGMDAASKYGIEEGCCGACLKAFCCTCCYMFQIQHEIMTKEGFHFGCMMIEKDGGAPEVKEMER